MINAQTMSKLMSLPFAHSELLNTVITDANQHLRNVEATALPIGHFNRLLRYQHLLSSFALTQIQLFCHAPVASTQSSDPDSLISESIEMQIAIAKRLANLSQDWIEGVVGISKQAISSQHVNTVDKLIEGDMNAMLQLGNLITTQTTALSELMVGIQVGVGRMLTGQR